VLAADEEVSNDHETLPGTRGSEERERTHPEGGGMADCVDG